MDTDGEDEDTEMGNRAEADEEAGESSAVFWTDRMAASTSVAADDGETGTGAMEVEVGETSISGVGASEVSTGLSGSRLPVASEGAGIITNLLGRGAR